MQARLVPRTAGLLATVVAAAVLIASTPAAAAPLAPAGPSPASSTSTPPSPAGVAPHVAPEVVVDPSVPRGGFSFFRGRAVAGDVTGDGIADKVTLGYRGDPGQLRCGVLVRPGLGRGQFGAPVVLTLPVRGDRSQTFQCPDIGVVLAGPTPAQNRLAVSFFSFSPFSAPSVQVFSLVGGRATYAAGFDGEDQPGYMGARDVDGDGFDDLWEVTDQGGGLQVYAGSGTTYAARYLSPPSTATTVQFFDLNHNAGTDIVLDYDFLGFNSGAVVVDGLTGAQQTLAAVEDTPDTSFDASVIDVDHDAYPDIRVGRTDTTEFGPVVSVSQWLNRSRAGTWTFVELGAAAG